MLAEREISQTREALLTRLAEARRQSDELFSIVLPEFLYERPIAERHRIVFYLGHLEAFDWNLLRERLFDLPSFDPEYDRLFAFGIDPVDGGLPHDRPADWPAVEAVRDYVARVRGSIDLAVARLPEFSSESQSKEILLNVAIEHRLMHAETLAYMLHQAPLEWKAPPFLPADLKAEDVVERAIQIPAGLATLGISRNERQKFGWDNEYEAHKVHVPEFFIDRYKVTNAQFLKFVNAGGYDDPAWWTTPDWKWKSQSNVSHPSFWRSTQDGWHLRTMFRNIALPADWPVYVSQAEASAYARWAGKRLPTEAEWHRAAYGTSEGQERDYPWGGQAPNTDLGNFDFRRWDPVSVGAHPSSKSAFGVQEMVGNGWEWTSTPFAPFPGFEPFEFYPGYSANFFDGKHYVMNGGSARTAASLLRRSFRNWFQPHYPFVYAGFRCVNDPVRI